MWMMMLVREEEGRGSWGLVAFFWVADKVGDGTGGG